MNFTGFLSPKPDLFSLALAAFSLAVLTRDVSAGVSTFPVEGLIAANGQVNAILETNGVVYFGGNFTEVGTNIGRAVPVDSSAIPLPNFPIFDRPVNAIIPDGAGGWYAGGDFQNVGGTARLRLVHLLGDLSVDANFSADLDGAVSALLLEGTNLYVGGSFSSIINSISGVNVTTNARVRFAVLDSTSGLPRSIAGTNGEPSFDGTISALAADGSVVYVGGGFLRVTNGASINNRTRLAAIDLTTGLPKTMGGTNGEPSFDNTVLTMQKLGTTLFVGGSFVRVTNVAWSGTNPTIASTMVRSRLAAIDSTTGRPTTFQADMNNTVRAVLLNGTGFTNLFVGGDFTFTTNSDGFQSCARIIALERETGFLNPEWRPDLDGVVTALALDGVNLYLGGTFSNVTDNPGGVKIPRRRVVGLSANTALPATASSFAPNPGGPLFNGVSINTVAANNGKIYLGGAFHFLNTQSRNRLAAFDAASGALLPWNPDANNQVRTLASRSSGGTAVVYAGGEFGMVGGASRSYLVALDTNGSVITNFNPVVNGTVETLTLVGTNLYLGGRFTSANGTTRKGIAAVDPVTGSVSPGFSASVLNSISASFGVSSLECFSNLLFAGGSFSFANPNGFQQRGLAAFDLDTGAWNSNAVISFASGSVVSNLAIARGSLFFSGTFTNVTNAAGAASPRNRLAAISLSTGSLDTNWNPNASNNTVTALAVSPDDYGLYAGGSFTAIKGQLRNRLAEIGLPGDVPTGWSPDLDSSVIALRAGGTRLYAGGSFGAAGQGAQGRSAGFITAFDYTLEANQPPHLLTGLPSFVSVATGSGVEWFVVVSGTAPFDYQWVKGGFAIAGATNAAYNLVGAPAEAAGNYSVVVSNPYGSVTSSIAVLTVLPPPTIDIQPESQLVAVGSNASFSVSASGNAPLNYQWRFKGANLAGATNMTLTRTNVLLSQTGSYAVVVSNSGGSVTSSPAILTLGYAVTVNADVGGTVIRNPATSLYTNGASVILTAVADSGYVFTGWGGGVSGTNNPLTLIVNSNITVAAGFAVPPVTTLNDGIPDPWRIQFFGTNFAGNPMAVATADADGDGANNFLEYQMGTSPVDAGSKPAVSAAVTINPGGGLFIDAVTVTLLTVLTNVTLCYTVDGSVPTAGSAVYTNTLTLTNSATIQARAFVNVNPVSEIASTSYSVAPSVCVPAPAGLAAWWPGEGNVDDLQGGHPAVFTNGAAYSAGKVGLAFSLNRANYVELSSASALNFSGNNAMSLELWAYRTGSGTAMHLAGKRAGASIQYQMSFDVPSGLAFVAGDNGGSLRAVTGVQMPMNTWMHLAATFDGTTARFYTNGELGAVAGGMLGGANAARLQIGASDGVSYPSVNFVGQIDEVGIYSRALTALEVAGIYNAQRAGKCAITPSLAITSQPAGQTVTEEGSVTLSVGVLGTGLINYQWQLNGTNLVGATNFSLLLPNVQLAQAGGYSVVVSNAAGSIASSNAVLTVNPGVCVPAPAGLVAWWPGEGDVGDVQGGHAAVFQNGAAYGAGRVGQAFSLNRTNYVELGSASNFNYSGTNAMSLELWAYRTGSGAFMHLAGKRAGGSIQYQMGFDVSDGLAFVAGNNGGSLRVATGIQMPMNTWMHLAATYDGTTGRFYINGVLKATANGSLGGASAARLQIGASDGVSYPSVNFEGQIDEVGIYSRALTVVEVAGIYNAQRAGKCAITPSLVITNQPAGQTVTEGGDVTLSVGVLGTGLITCQWRLDGTNLVGATNFSLLLTNVQLAQAGAYSVMVSSTTAGSVLSSNAVVTVNPAVCVSPPAGLVAWWQGDGQVGDVVGGHAAVFKNGAAYGAGKVGLAFSLNRANYVELGSTSALNFSGNNAMSLELWAYRTGSGTTMHLAGKRAGGSIQYQMGFDVPDGLQFVAGNNGGSLRAVTGVQMPMNTWMHLAATYDGATARFYTNGELSAVGGGTLGSASATLQQIGASDGLSYPSVNFEGQIDEVGIYSRALTAAEVAGIYNAQAMGKCITPSLAIISQPAGQTVTEGGNVTLSVGVSGTGLITCQWQLNGTNLEGATNFSLLLANVQLAQAGGYSVVVSNVVGSITSSNAVLTVNPAVCIPAPTGLVAWWPGEGDVGDVQGGQATVFKNGAAYSAGRVGLAFSLNRTNYVELGSASALNFSGNNAMSLELWAYRTGSGTTMHLAGKRSGGSIQYQMGFDVPSGLQFVAGDNGGSLRAVTGVQMPMNTWMHLAATYDGATARFYTNGELSAVGGGTLGGANAARLQIGASDGVSYPTVNFEGQIDEVGIYSRALTAVEVAGIYNAQKAGKCAIIPSLAITNQPAGQTVTEGGDVTLSVGVLGTGLITCQWRLDGTNLAGATNFSLLLTNVQLAQAGGYSVMVSNAAGSVLSSNAVMTVNPAVCVPAPTGLEAWWPGEGDVNDLQGGHPARFKNGAAYGAGRAGLAFSLNRTNYVELSSASALNFSGNSAMSLELWAYRTGSGTTMHLAGKRSGASIQYQLGFDSQYGLQFVAGNSGGSLRAVTGVQMPMNTWLHLAATYDGTTARFYINGVPGAAANGSLGTVTAARLQIGASDGVNNSSVNFVGQIDEVGIYSRALTASEVAGIYNAQKAGKCAIIPSLAITSQPAGQTVAEGGNVTLSVGVSGTGLITYQWQLNGTNLGGATNFSLLLPEVQLAQAGGYRVVVSSVVGSITSSNAVLTVNPGVCVSAPAGLVAWWPGEGDVGDVQGGHPAAFKNGAAYGAGKVGQAFSLNRTNYVELGSDSNFNYSGNDPMSLELWAYRTGNGAFMHLAGKRSGGSIQYQMSFDVSDGLAFVAGNYGGSLRVATGIQMPMNTWMHLAATYDGTTGRFYTNGVLGATANGSLGTVTSVRLQIGASDGVSHPSVNFVGQIDEVGIYSRALTAAEVAGIYNAQRAGKCAITPSLVITNQPAGQTVTEEGDVTLSVGVSGTGLITCQWRLDGTNLVGATNFSLILTNVQLAQAGNYSVMVSSTTAGSVLSSNAVVTVNPAVCVPAPAGLVAWWPGEGDVGDVQGGHPAAFKNGAAYGAGRVGQAFSLNRTNYVELGSASNFNYSGNDPMSLELWAYRTGSGIVMHLVGKRAGGSIQYQRGFDVSDGLAFVAGNYGGSLRVATGIQMPMNTWMHLAATYDGATGRFYTNGVLGATANGSLGTVTSTRLQIGALDGVNDPSVNFAGQIDEVGIYSRALTALEVAGIYNAQRAGKCAITPSLVITNQPAGQTVTEGDDVTLSVGVLGTRLITCQWRLDGTNLVGATNFSLLLTNVQLAQAGAYSVVVSNAAGSVLSSNAVVTVNPAVCVPAPAGLVAWWQGDGQVGDVAGGHAAVFTNGAAYSAGKVGLAFSLNRANYVELSSASALNFSGTNAMSLELWAYRTGSGTAMHLAGKRAGGSIQYQMSFDVPSGLAFVAGDNGGSLRAVTGVQMPMNTWLHLAATYDGTTARFYINGVVKAVTNGSLGTVSGALLQIGASDGLSYPSVNFEGQIDEVGIYSRALTAAEVAGIYNARAMGKCITPSLAITNQPAGQTVTEGGSVTLSVGVSGTGLISYQWQLNGTNLGGATNFSLSLTDVQLAQAGGYSVVVSNTAGSIASSNAVLTVNPGVCVPAPAGLVAWWPGEGDVGDVQGGHAAVFQNGAAYGAGRVGQAFTLNRTNYVELSSASALNFSGNNAMSLELWAYRTGSGTAMHLAGKRAGGSIQYQMSFDVPSGLAFVAGNEGGSLRAATGVQMPMNTWMHLAATFDGTTARFYINGVPGAVANGSLGTVTAARLQIGASDGVSYPSVNFEGQIDEVGIYSRALTALEVAGIYNAQKAGKCAIIPSLVITNQPAGQTVTEGGDVTLSVGVLGTGLITCQWRLDGTNLGGATNFSLLLTNVQLAQAGNYSVMVSSSTAGSVLSSNAVVTVLGLVQNLFDDFDPGIDSLQWSAFGGTALGTNYGGAVSGSYSLWFDGTGSRFATTRALNTVGGGAIGYFLRLASGTSLTWETADLPSEGVVLEYSVNDGTQWAAIATNNTSAFMNWVRQQFQIPPGAQSARTFFRWRQLSNSGANFDHWALDDVSILTPIVPVAPEILSGPEGYAAVAGENVNFAVSALGTSPLRYQWRFNGTALAGATNATLVLTGVARSHSGYYAMTITNAFGSVTSSNALLSVGGVAQRILPLTALGGGRYRISFSDFGGGPLFPWDLDNLEIEVCSDLIAENWVSVFKPIVISNGVGQVEFVATNSPPQQFYRVRMR